jgi:putative ABC transport system substrate-binding protein
VRRGEFITAVAGAIALPLVARAQQNKVAKLGYVSWIAPTRVESLREGLRNLGYIEGAHYQIEVHFVDGNREQTANTIQSLIDKGVDVLIVRATPAAHIAKQLTKTIPIVMIVSDALSTGLVPSLSQPGGNLTGVSNFGPDLAGKRLELLREIRPELRTVAFLGSSTDPNGTTFVRQTKEAADRAGLKLVVRMLDGPVSIDESAFQSMKRDGVEAVIIQPIFTAQRIRIVDLAKKVQLPLIADFRQFAEAGAMVAFGVDDSERTRRAAYFVDRILKGAKPADLPVEQPTTFRLVLNVLAAKAVGWTIPALLLARADEVIE